jgi:hypothetical protein
MSDPDNREQGAGPAPSEEELRAAYEAELSRITATDMIAQAAVSLLNVGARRIGPPPGAPEGAGAAGGQDLEQVRDAVDAARALLEILERRIPGELGPLRDALSRLQMAYAAEAGGTAPRRADESAGQPQEPSAPAQQGVKKPGEDPGPAESSGRLWVPGR